MIVLQAIQVHTPDRHLVSLVIRHHNIRGKRHSAGRTLTAEKDAG